MQKKHLDIVFRNVHWFLRKYGVPKDELLPEAYFGYMNAISNYSPGMGKTLEQWIGIKVRGALMVYRTNRITYYCRHRKNVHDIDVPATENSSTFDIKEFLGDLSEDAKFVATLVIQLPNTIEETAREYSNAKRAYKNDSITPRAYQKAIREFLEGMDWTKEQIQKVFAEIQQKLNCERTVFAK